jgi:hypothetical protein
MMIATVVRRLCGAVLRVGTLLLLTILNLGTPAALHAGVIYPNSLWIGNDLSGTLPLLNTDRSGNVLRQINAPIQVSGIAIDIANNIIYTGGNFASAAITPRDLTNLVPGTPFTPVVDFQEDMTFDGSFIWRISSNRVLEKINPTTGLLDSAFSIPTGTGGNIATLGIAWDGSGFWVSEHGVGGQIAKYTTNGTLIAGTAFAFNSTLSPAGLAYDTTDNTLYIGTNGAVYHYSLTGTQLGSFTLPGWGLVDGLEFEGGVPEPSTSLLMLTGLAVLGIPIHRRRGASRTSLKARLSA